MRRADLRIPLLLNVLEHAYHGKGWQGTTLRGALRGLTPRQALWRPRPGRHCIWELVVHAAYWKYAVRQRLTGGAPGAFARRPANWPAVPTAADAKAWKADLALLEAEHRALRAAVEALPPARLAARSPSGKWTYAELIHGVAAHDCYHTGQIQLLKRLQRQAGA